MTNFKIFVHFPNRKTSFSRSFIQWNASIIVTVFHFFPIYTSQNVRQILQYFSGRNACRRSPFLLFMYFVFEWEAFLCFFSNTLRRVILKISLKNVQKGPLIFKILSSFLESSFGIFETLLLCRSFHQGLKTSRFKFSSPLPSCIWIFSALCDIIVFLISDNCPSRMIFGNF